MCGELYVYLEMNLVISRGKAASSKSRSDLFNLTSALVRMFTMCSALVSASGGRDGKIGVASRSLLIHHSS